MGRAGVRIVRVSWLIFLMSMVIGVLVVLRMPLIPQRILLLGLEVSVKALCFSLGFVSLIIVIPSLPFLRSRTRKVNLIYASRFYASWSRRMWEVALPLVLIDIFGNSLVPTAIYTIIVYSSLIIVQPYVGIWADRTNRAVVQYTMVTAENLSIGLTCVVLASLSWKYVGTDTSLSSHNTISVSFAVLILLGIIGEVSVGCSAKMLENDWIAVLAKSEGESLAELNVQMNRISLFAKGLGPAAFTFIYSSYGVDPKQRVLFSMVTLLIWNLLSYPLEVLYTRRVYNATPSLAEKSHLHSNLLEEHRHLSGEKTHFHLRCLEGEMLLTFEVNQPIVCDIHQLPSSLSDNFKWNQESYTIESFFEYLRGLKQLRLHPCTSSSSIKEALISTNPKEFLVEDIKNAEFYGLASVEENEGWLHTFHEFTQHYVFPLCLAHEMLWFSVLNNGNLMMSYLHVARIPAYWIGISRSAGSVIGLTGTFLYEHLFHRYSLEKRAIVSIWLMLLPVLPIAIIFLSTSNVKEIAYPLMICTAFSRIGYWCFSLSRQEVFQRKVEEKKRGAFSGMHTTFYNFFYILMFVVGIKYNQTENFYVLSLLSVACVSVATALASVWYCFRVPSGSFRT